MASDQAIAQDIQQHNIMLAKRKWAKLNQEAIRQQLANQGQERRSHFDTARREDSEMLRKMGLRDTDQVEKSGTLLNFFYEPKGSAMRK